MKKINLILSTAAVFSLPILTISCFNSKKRLRFTVNSPYSGEKNHKFFNEILYEFNKRTKTETDLEIKYIGKNNDAANVIKKGTSSIAFLTTPLFISEVANKDFKEVSPILQTVTRALKFDTNFDDQYSDGSKDDKLIKIANEAQKMFEAKAYKDWDDKEYKWNGSIYEHFYAPEDKLVEYYRGLVMIWGTKEEREAIRKAWNEKDWNTFRNFGILTNKETSSGSKYILQQELFRKHFNKEGNKFTSFAIDKKEHADKYGTTSKASRDMGKGENKKYHIVFDDLGSFAYTNAKKTAKDKLYEPEGKNVSVEFLTVTEPIKYNIVAINTSVFNKKEAKILQEIFIDLWKNKKDDYGPSVGFNGYKLINDVNKDVIDPYKKVFL